MIKYVQCRNCLNKNGSFAPKGYILKKVLAGDGKTQIEVLEECKCHIEWRKAVALEKQFNKANINPDIVKYDINTYQGTKSLDNLNRLKNFVNMYFSKNTPEDVREKLVSATLYLYGPNGTQKTTLAKWFGYQFIKNKKTVYYTLMNDLVKLLQKSERDEEAQAKIDKILDRDLLIIDEAFMKERVLIYHSGYQLSFIDTFLRNRLQSKKKCTVFISNIEPSKIDESVFGIGLKDLVTRNVLLSTGLLLFEDNYMDNLSNIDENNLF